VTFRQLEIARHCRAALKSIFFERPGGRADNDTLAEIQELCLGAMRALDDPICGGKIVTVYCCAAALYSDSAHESWTRGKTPGVDVLRRKIFRALNVLQRRLYALERQRRAPDPRKMGPERALPPEMSASVQISTPGAGE
jgi:hypothetical protein